MAIQKITRMEKGGNRLSNGGVKDYRVERWFDNHLFDDTNISWSHILPNSITVVNVGENILTNILRCASISSSTYPGIKVGSYVMLSDFHCVGVSGPLHSILGPSAKVVH